MKNIAVILASGTGSRCKLEKPKQFFLINNKTILEYSIDAFESNDLIDEIIIVTNFEYINLVRDISNKYTKVSRVINGGKTRKESSFLGITSIKESEANILIHDAVRPLITDNIITKCIDSLKKYNAVCVGIESSDTIFIVDEDNNITNIPNRKFLRRGQTPQCFKLSLIKKAHEIAIKDLNCCVTDDCGLITNYTNEKIHIVCGSEDNIKITYKDDLAFVESKLIN